MKDTELAVCLEHRFQRNLNWMKTQERVAGLDLAHGAAYESIAIAEDLKLITHDQSQKRLELLSETYRQCYYAIFDAKNGVKT